MRTFNRKIMKLFKEFCLKNKPFLMRIIIAKNLLIPKNYYLIIKGAVKKHSKIFTILLILICSRISKFIFPNTILLKYYLKYKKLS